LNSPSSFITQQKTKYQAVPDELKAHPHWVTWRLEKRTGNEEKFAKIPYNVKTGRRASSTDLNHWATFPQALAAVQKDDGIGFVFAANDPYCGIDLDHCRDAGTGTIEPWALEIVKRLNSYTEISPSGTGLHIFIKGNLPKDGKNRKGQIEMYTQGRYFTVTGNQLQGTPATIETRQEELTRWYNETFGCFQKSTGEVIQFRESSPVGLSDDAILQKAWALKSGQAFQLLFNGDWQTGGYCSQSEADLALCNYLVSFFGKQPEKIDRLFRRSGLMREKWDQKRGARTYGQVTIAKAINGNTSVYTPSKKRESRSNALTINPDQSAFEIKTTDMGNADRLINRHGKNLKYCYLWSKWLIWNNVRWVKDDVGQIYKLAKETVRAIYNEAATVISDKESKGLAKHALKSQNDSRIRAMINQAQPEVPITPDELDSNPMLLNVKNGTLDLFTGEILPHCREHLITKLAPVEFIPGAKCPKWEMFLSEIMGGKSELMTFLQTIVGYSLTGDTREQCLFILYGSGANGKTTFLNIIGKLLGDYAQQTPTDTLMVKNNGGVPNDIARLKGARFVAATEAEEGKRLAESTIKQLTGGDTITARFMRAEFFEFKAEFKIFLGTNHRPEIKGTDYGIWRRMRLIPFEVTIPAEKQDKHLGDKLEKELPGILNWALEGCKRWQREGLIVPPSCANAVREYQRDVDYLTEFFDSECVFRSDVQIYAGRLFQAFDKWRAENGFEIMSQTAFGRRLKEKGCVKIKLDNKRTWRGICLKGEATVPLVDTALEKQSIDFDDCM
jgi:putative DNA primase/helicase